MQLFTHCLKIVNVLDPECICEFFRCKANNQSLKEIYNEKTDFNDNRLVAGSR